MQNLFHFMIRFNLTIFPLLLLRERNEKCKINSALLFDLTSPCVPLLDKERDVRKDRVRLFLLLY